MEIWKVAACESGGIHTQRNLTFLLTLVQDMWDRARLALKPPNIPEDITSIGVRYCWLPSRDVLPKVPLCHPPPIPADPEVPSRVPAWCCTYVKSTGNHHGTGCERKHGYSARTR